MILKQPWLERRPAPIAELVGEGRPLSGLAGARTHVRSPFPRLFRDSCSIFFEEPRA